VSDDDEVDQLYAGTPEDFTALRTELVAAARKRGDKDAAKRIGAARRPTVAAWVVNLLVRTDVTARVRLSELGEELRAAHAAMDGARIRELSTVQRKLIDALARAGFAAAGLSQPSAAMRDDVVGTLQAAIADPEVAARLGRLSTAERWSGFGEFGAVSAVGTRAPRKPNEPKPSEPEPSDRQEDAGPTAEQVRAATDRVSAARGDVDSAERAHAAAVEALSERQSHLTTARRRYEKLLEKLSAAEEELGAADTAHAAAEEAVRTQAESAQTAKAHLAIAEADLAALGGDG
jgi:hypothetical protein